MNCLDIALALLPIVVIFVLLFVFKQSSTISSLISYIVAIIIGIFSPYFSMNISSFFDATVEGLLLTIIVAYVLLFGIWLFHLMNEAGLIQEIANFIANSTQDRTRQALMLAIAFSPLVESISGFGIAVIVIAPILIALGFPKVQAAMLALISLTAVPWGALSTGTVIGANLTGLSVHSLGAGTASLSIFVFVYFTVITVFIVGGWKEVRRKWLEIITVSGSLFAAIWFFSRYVSVELAGVFASLVTLFVEWLWICALEKDVLANNSKEKQPHRLLKALSPYLLLTSLLFLSRLVPQVNDWLLSHWTIEINKYSFELPLLYSPGFFLLVTCLFVIVCFQMKYTAIQKTFVNTWKQWVPVNVSMFGFVAMAQVMMYSGMTQLLAETSADKLGSIFIVLSPLIGAMGGFLTGSNTGSNAMFMKLQVQTAQLLDLSPELIANSQNASAGHITMASPSRVLLSATISQVRHEESKLLKRLAVIAGGALLIIILQSVVSYFVTLFTI